MSKLTNDDIQQIRLDELFWMLDRLIQEDYLEDIKESVEERIEKIKGDNK